MARSGIRDHGSHSKWTSRPCSPARSHSAGEGLGGVVDAPGPPKTSTALTDRAPRRSADGEQLGLAETEDVLGVELGGID